MQKFKANPLFSEETCQKFFATKQKLGGPVPPREFVTGCTEVCAMVKDMKEFWKTGGNAPYACENGKSFGCVWDGTPPVTLGNIGC